MRTRWIPEPDFSMYEEYRMSPALISRFRAELGLDDAMNRLSME